ncbi:MAG: ribosomal protein S18-alanine N-acetyltransferase [Gemmatimonadota bacterium]
MSLRADPGSREGGAFATPSIRRAEERDLEAVLEVERASFTLPWGEESFRSLMGLARATFLVADVGGEIVGHAVAWWAGGEGEVANLAVRPAFRLQGVATLLLDHVLERARREALDAVFLEVRTSNITAFELYRSRGFEEVGLRRAYYRNPTEDARVLRLDLEVTGTPGKDPPSPPPLDETGRTNTHL